MAGDASKPPLAGVRVVEVAMMSGEGRNIFVLAPWLVIFPGLAITITVLVFNLFGDTVRDVLDPRLREA